MLTAVTTPLDRALLTRIEADWRAANYLSVGQIYLYDVPTLETPAAVSLLRRHLPALKIRVINVVDLMKLQPQSEHPHGLPDRDFDILSTTDKPIVFAFHGYPWLVHRLTYRRTNHGNLHGAATRRRAPRRPRSTWWC
jgi:phosphoketolase